MEKITTASEYGTIFISETSWEDILQIVKGWKELQQELRQVVTEGYRKGYNNKPDTTDGVKLIAYRYILDRMKTIEEGEINE